MSRNRRRMPPPELLRAFRCLAGVGHHGDLLDAIRTVLAALEVGVTLPRSAVLDLARVVFDADVDMDRHLRLAAAEALARSDEREIANLAASAIRDSSASLGVATAAATFLLGSPHRRLSRPTLTGLVRKIRRFGQVRGPLVDLLQSNKLPSPPNRRVSR